VPDPARRTSLLLDLVEACGGESTCPEPPTHLLEEAGAEVRKIADPFRRAELLLRLARLQRQLGLEQAAAISVGEARRLGEDTQGTEGGALLLKLGLAGRGLESPQTAAALLAEGQRRLEPTAPAPSFPFAPAPTELQVGFGLSGASFRDSTAVASINLDLYAQGARRDLDVDLLALAEYDSTRSFNTIRPNGQAFLVFRHHLDRRWNLFFGQLASVNNDTFASRDDDEDLSVLSVSLAGIGLNLWRDANPSSFVEAQLGVGVRYEYEFIDFEQRQNRLDPNLTLLLRAREVPVGKGRINQILALGSLMNEWDNALLWSTTSISFPLSKRWRWKNELVFRYRTEPVDNDDPNLNAIFSTGLTYQF
jgi:hypothetical protein